MRFSIPLVFFAAALSLAGQTVSQNPLYVRTGFALPYDSLKAYLGGANTARILEVGHDIAGPDEVIGFGVYASYLFAQGKPSDRYRDVLSPDDDSKALRQHLYGWRMGGELRFRTPVKALTPYAGLSLNWYDGRVAQGSYVPNWDNPAQPYYLPSGHRPERKVKFGGRVGAEYRFTETWGMALDFNYSEWLSDDAFGSYTPQSGPRYRKGVNPVNPAWFGLSVQYRGRIF